jgi:hypothetical protein
MWNQGNWQVFSVGSPPIPRVRARESRTEPTAIHVLEELGNCYSDPAQRGAMARRLASPHLQSYKGDIRDYNGTGAWSAPAVQTRYRQYCDVLQVEYPRVLKAKEHREGKLL